MKKKKKERNTTIEIEREFCLWNTHRSNVVDLPFVKSDITGTDFTDVAREKRSGGRNDFPRIVETRLGVRETKIWTIENEGWLIRFISVNRATRATLSSKIFFYQTDIRILLIFA